MHMKCGKNMLSASHRQCFFYAGEFMGGPALCCNRLTVCRQSGADCLTTRQDGTSKGTTTHACSAKRAGRELRMSALDLLREKVLELAHE